MIDRVYRLRDTELLVDLEVTREDGEEQPRI